MPFFVSLLVFFRSGFRYAPTSADEGDCNLAFASPENTNDKTAAWAECLAGVMA